MSGLKKYIFVALIALVFVGGDSVATNGPIAVIVNADNGVNALEANDVRRIYNNKTLKWGNGTRIIIYDLALYDPIRSKFSTKILGKTAEQIAEHWAHLKITNQAVNPPVTLKSQRLIIRRVSMQKGAIGYVSLDSVKDNKKVKVVDTIN